MDALRQAAGRTILVGIPSGELEPDTADRLRRNGYAGVILFGRNLQEPAQTAALLRDVADCLPHPPLLAIDQEGGRVSRLEPWIGATPSATALARAGIETLTQFGIVTGELLAALGFNLDFAPVVDLSPEDVGNGIGDRAYSTDPAKTVRSAGAFLNGLQSTGVAGCLKHFPGLGDTAVDSHLELPCVTRSEEQLHALDLRPYRELARRAACVMVGHAHYPAIDGDEPLPGTCSRTIVQGWLREQMGYDGLAVSDDMEMGAVAPRDVDGQAAFEALSAGLDLLLYCKDLNLAETAIERVVREASGDATFAARVQEAASRVEVISRLWPAPAADLDRFELARNELGRVSERV